MKLVSEIYETQDIEGDNYIYRYHIFITCFLEFKMFERVRLECIRKYHEIHWAK